MTLLHSSSKPNPNLVVSAFCLKFPSPPSLLPPQPTTMASSAGASLTYPIRAGEVKKGSYVLLKNHPCKVCFAFCVLLLCSLCCCLLLVLQMPMPIAKQPAARLSPSGVCVCRLFLWWWCLLCTQRCRQSVFAMTVPTDILVAPIPPPPLRSLR